METNTKRRAPRSWQDVLKEIDEKRRLHIQCKLNGSYGREDELRALEVIATHLEHYQDEFDMRAFITSAILAYNETSTDIKSYVKQAVTIGDAAELIADTVKASILEDILYAISSMGTISVSRQDGEYTIQNETGQIKASEFLLNVNDGIDWEPEEDGEDW